ncbi:MAG: HTH domain-containing protein [Bacteroidota bacterium]
MDFQTYYERLEYILETTEKGRLISLNQLAQNFNCSERTVKRMIATLRNRGHHIYYHRHAKRFVLREEALEVKS